MNNQRPFRDRENSTVAHRVAFATCPPSARDADARASPARGTPPRGSVLVKGLAACLISGAVGCGDAIVDDGNVELGATRFEVTSRPFALDVVGRGPDGAEVASLSLRVGMVTEGG